MGTRRQPSKARKTNKTQAAYCPKCGSTRVSRSYSKPGGVNGAGRNQDFKGICGKCDHTWPV